MILGIMQPYLFPYIGYFQHIAHCDVFVLLDDVQYIGGGWINRNRILLNGAPTWVTVPVRGASHTLAINQRHYDLGSGAPVKMLRRINAAYHGAPFLDITLPVVARVLGCEESNVADFNARAIGEIVAHLGIGTRILRSSHMPGLEGLKGVYRVIAICKALGASTYVNSIGGMSLYTPEPFTEAGIDLRFLEANSRVYSQFSPHFVPYLSTIDVMMHNDPVALNDRLSEYRVLEPLHSPLPHQREN